MVLNQACDILKDWSQYKEWSYWPLCC